MRVDQVTGQLTIGQLASRTGVRADTIRYYEREGLLPLPHRTEGEHRRYGEADVDRLLFVRGAQRLGLRLAEIRELLAVRDTAKGSLAAAPSLLCCLASDAEAGRDLGPRVPGFPESDDSLGDCLVQLGGHPDHGG